MSFFEDAIATIGRGLAQTATRELSDATGYDIGGTLNFLFGNDQTKGGEDLSNLIDSIPEDFKGSAEQLAFLQETLSQQGQFLMDIGGELTAITQSINSIALEINKIQDLLAEIKQQQLFIAWQNVDLQITVYSNAIDTAYRTYSNYIRNYLTTPTTEVEELKTDILNVNNGPIVGMNGISKLILDNSMSKGALQLWSNMVCELVNAGKMDYRDAVDQYISYYQKLAFAQLTATNLVMEAYNLSDDSHSSVAFYDSYKETILSQETTFIEWLIPIVNAGITGSASSKVKGDFVYTGVDASAQLNPIFPTLENFTEYYSPSEILRRAESTLNALYNTDVADRRIVVYMTYLGYSSMKNLLQNVIITLTTMDKDIIQPDYYATLGAFAFPPDVNSRYPDPNWTTDDEGYYVKRFVFTANEESMALPDKSFTLTNLNGSGNLVPQETYASTFNQGAYGGKAPFMADSITNYVLTVDETTQFDFMNFFAYCYPSARLYS